MYRISSSPDVTRKIPKTKIPDENKSSGDIITSKSQQEIETQIKDEEEGIIIHPHENDILMGRGGKNNQHTGNEKFRRLARQESQNYQVASKKGKSSISRMLVKQVRCMDPPGRFLKKNNETGTWEDVGDEIAREKASQVLRDAISILRDTGSEGKADYKLDEESDNNTPFPSSVPSVTPSTKRRYWEDFTCSELRNELPQQQPPQPQRAYPHHLHHPHHPYYYHPYTAPPPPRYVSPKRSRYDMTSWDERASHMAQYHRPLPPHHPPTTPQIYSQTPFNSPSASMTATDASMTATDEFDLFNGEILNSDDEDDDDDDESVNDVVDVFEFDQSEESKGINAKIWPV